MYLPPRFRRADLYAVWAGTRAHNLSACPLGSAGTLLAEFSRRVETARMSLKGRQAPADPGRT